jgi:hypothetical protein
MNDSAGFFSHSITTRSGSCHALSESGFNNTAFTTLKITVFAPIPNAKSEEHRRYQPGLPAEGAQGVSHILPQNFHELSDSTFENSGHGLIELFRLPVKF